MPRRRDGRSARRLRRRGRRQVRTARSVRPRWSASSACDRTSINSSSCSLQNARRASVRSSVSALDRGDEVRFGYHAASGASGPCEDEEVHAREEQHRQSLLGRRMEQQPEQGVVFGDDAPTCRVQRRAGFGTLRLAAKAFGELLDVTAHIRTIRTVRRSSSHQRAAGDRGGGDGEGP